MTTKALILGYHPIAIWSLCDAFQKCHFMPPKQIVSMAERNVRWVFSKRFSMVWVLDLGYYQKSHFSQGKHATTESSTWLYGTMWIPSHFSSMHRRFRSCMLPWCHWERIEGCVYNNRIYRRLSLNVCHDALFNGSWHKSNTHTLEKVLRKDSSNVSFRHWKSSFGEHAFARNSHVGLGSDFTKKIILVSMFRS